MNEQFQWSDVRVFLEVARTGKMTQAGRRIGVSHTTIMRRLARLEEVLGARLFEPGPEGLHPTPAGLALLPLAEDMEGRAKAILDLLQRPGALTGRVRIGAPDGFGSAFLAQILPGLMAAEPGLEIELLPLPAAHKLWNRDVDIAISLDRPSSGRLVMQRLLDYDLRLYGAQELLNGNIPTGKEALRSWPFVGYIDELRYTEVLDFNRLIGDGLRTPYRAATVQAQRDAVVAGAGLGVLPCYLTRGTGLIPILPDDVRFERTYWLLFSEEDRNLARIRRVAEFIRHETQARQKEFRFHP